MDDDKTNWTWIRHAPAASSGCFCGHSDPPLATDAPNDFAQLAQRLPKADIVFCSPLIRATQTWDALTRAGFHAPQIESAPALMEQNFGIFEGKLYSEVTLPGEGLADWQPEGGESFVQVVARTKAFVNGVVHSRQGTRFCLIAHAGIVRAAITAALGISPAHGLSFSVAPLSATSLTRFADGNWQIDYINRIAGDDRSHDPNP